MRGSTVAEEARTISDAIIRKQQKWLTQEGGWDLFRRKMPSEILSHSTGFDWWIFPGYTGRRGGYEQYKIPTFEEDPQTRKAVYDNLRKNHQFMANYRICLREYFQCMVNNPNHIPFDMRMHKVFESMRNIGFENIGKEILGLAKTAMNNLARENRTEYHSITRGSKHYTSHFQAFEKYVAVPAPAPPPAAAPPPPPPPLGAKQPVKGVIARAAMAYPTPSGAGPAPVATEPQNFRRRYSHENALLRFLVRAFNNNRSNSCNIAAARFVASSPLHLIAQGNHERARLNLLAIFQNELGLMNAKKSSYFNEISRKLNFADKKNLATNFVDGLYKWINELQKPNALQGYATAFQNSKNNARILTTRDFDQTQLDSILKTKARTALQGSKAIYSNNIFKFQLSTTSCQIATPQGLPLINASGQLGAEFSLNSFCYPNFRKSLNSDADVPTIEKAVTAQFTLALQNLQKDIKHPKNNGLFVVIPPGAFVRNMTVPNKNLVAEIIVRSLQAAITKVNDPRIKIQFSGSQKMNNTTDDFGWGNVLPQIRSIADKTQPFVKSELFSQAQYCQKNNIAFQIPMMGEPLGAVGNGASGPGAESATDEYIARAAGGMHCVTLNAEKNPQLIRNTNPKAKPQAAAGAAPTPPKPNPKPQTATKFNSIESQIKSYCDKTLPEGELKKTIDDQINSQIAVPDPKQVYKGCGIKATFNSAGQLMIEEVFANNINRFGQMQNGKYTIVSNSALLNSTITKINSRNISEMTLEEIAKACHDPNKDTEFEIKKGNQLYALTCAAADKNLFVTKSCGISNILKTFTEEGGKAGDKYDVDKHGIKAIDPNREIQKKFNEIQPIPR